MNITERAGCLYARGFEGVGEMNGWFRDNPSLLVVDIFEHFPGFTVVYSKEDI